jgi:hypothetical protein
MPDRLKEPSGNSQSVGISNGLQFSETDIEEGYPDEIFNISE